MPSAVGKEERKIMEEALLGGVKEEEQKWKTELKEEVKKIGYLSLPMMAVMVTQYLLQVISVMMVGHLGELALSGIAISSSFTNVTGFSFIVGLACGLETLCGQAYGAKLYQKLGPYTYCSIICLLPVCIPICFIWIYMDKLLILLGQDPDIAAVACKYSIFLLPGLLACPFLQSISRYFMCQTMVLPLLVSSSAALCVHVPLCWILVYKTNMGIIGSALSTGLALWINVLILGMFMRFSSACEESRVFVWKDVVSSVKEFFSFAIPSALMVCLEWWAVEILILLSGILPNSKLETSVLSICLTTSSLHFLFVPFGVSAAASIRISNELGAGNPQAARLSVIVAVAFAAVEPILVAIVLFSCRYVYGYLFSNEKQVVDYVAEMIPLLCCSMTLDSIQAVLCGIARGTGWQHIGAYVNLGAYYVVGVPVAVLLCFVLDLGGKGLWVGIIAGVFVQTAVFSLITGFTNWEKQITNARERMFEGANSTQQEERGNP